MAKFCMFWLKGSHAILNLQHMLRENPIIDDMILYAWCRYDKLDPRLEQNELDLFMKRHDLSYFHYDTRYKMNKSYADEFCDRYKRYEIVLEEYTDRDGTKVPVGVTRDENFYIRDCEAESIGEFVDNHMQRLPLKFLTPKMQKLLYSIGYSEIFIDDEFDESEIRFTEKERWMLEAKKYSDAHDWQCETAALSVIFSPLVADLADPIASMKIEEGTGLWVRKR